jgi:sugar/nucleoside kinase (ribokinase family)
MGVSLHVRVVLQHPRAGCRLYAAYAAVLAAHLDTRTEFVVTAERDAHGSELLNGCPKHGAQATRMTL